MKKRRVYSLRDARGGQMLVVVMMMITTVIIMFGMTVSIGHLVQSKINLQNSVDLASLSAASYQARYMNAMSVANYRIRSVMKFFLMDSYVTQARFNNKFTTDVLGGGSGTISDPIKTLSACEQAKNYDPVSAIGEGGRGVDDTTNVCKNLTDTPTTITPLIASPIPGFNPIYIFINLTLLQIAAQFEQSCLEWKGQNGVWARWAVNRAVSDTDQQAAQMTTITNDFAADLAGRARPDGRGGLSAYATFESNLIGSLIGSASDDNSLLYLNESNERVLDLTDLQKSEKSFGLSYVEPEWAGGCQIKVNTGGAQATAQTMTQGYSKRPGKIVAVGFVANADRPSILFWPQGIEPAMVAIAAAKPFGSRIGPPADYFAKEGGGGYGNVTTFIGDDGGALSAGGLGHKDLLRAAYQRLPAPGSGVPSQRPKEELAYMAYAPTIFDSLYYSIFPAGSPFAPQDIPAVGKLKIDSPLRDRGGSLPNPYAWTLPKLPKYYNKDAMQSAWSPDAEPRNGYQIKLLSIDDFCNTSTAAKLVQICGEEGTRLL